MPFFDAYRTLPRASEAKMPRKQSTVKSEKAS
jgi:hypothetical protein